MPPEKLGPPQSPQPAKYDEDYESQVKNGDDVSRYEVDHRGHSESLSSWTAWVTATLLLGGHRRIKPFDRG